MRSINIFLVTLLLTSFAFSQEIIEMGPFPVPKYFQTHDTYVSNEAIVLNLCPYSGINNLHNIKQGIYHHLVFGSQNTFTTRYIREKQAEGKEIVLNSWYSGDTITEFVVFYNPGLPNFECTYAILNRSCKTMERFGERKLLATHKFYNGYPEKYQNMQLLKADNGFVFVEMTDKKGTVTFLSETYEETNKIELDEQFLSSISCKECYYPNINEDGSVLLVFPDLKLGPINDSKDQILRVSEEGEMNWYKTDISNSPDLIASVGRYAYNPKTQELSKVFFASNAEKNRNGYGITQWDRDGNIVSNNTVLLSFEDIFKNEPEIQNYFKSNKVSTTDIWGKLDYFARINLIYDGKEKYIFIQRPHITYELTSAVYVIKIDETGNLQWIKPLLSEVRDPINFHCAIPYIKNGKLNLLLADYITNSKGNEHVNKSFKKEGAAIAFFHLVLDPLNGDELTNEKYDVQTENGCMITNMAIQMDNQELKGVIELRKDKQLFYKLIKL